MGFLDINGSVITVLLGEDSIQLKTYYVLKTLNMN